MAVALAGAVAVYAWSGQTSSASDRADPADRATDRVAAGDIRSLDQRPTLIAKSVEIHHFDDVATMTATSQLVVRGHVTDVRPGRRVGPPENQIRIRDVSIAVDEVLANRGRTVPKTLLVDEWAWDSRGRGVEFDGVTWTEPGDRGIYFLVPVADAPGHYRLINSQGRVLLHGGELAPSADHHDDIYTEMVDQSPADLAQGVRQAFRDYRSGRVEPQQPAVGR